MKFLITGGAGFIGGHLAKSLASEGHEVHILDNLKRGVRDTFLDECVNALRAKFINADLLQSDELSNLDNDYTHIYHLAAIIGVQHVLERPFEVLTSNVRLTENVITLAQRQKKLKRLLFASTSEVYAGSLIHTKLPIPTPESVPIVLTELDVPRTSYMLSKLYGEAMCNLCGLPTTIVRFHNIYGPRMGMSHVIPELLFRAWKAKNGDELEVFSINHQRTFCYVDDAIHMIRLLTEGDVGRGQTVNIGNESPEVKIEDIANIVIDTVGRKLRIAPRHATHGSPERRCPRTQLLNSLVSLEGSVSLQDGVRRTYEWYRQEIFANNGITAT